MIRGMDDVDKALFCALLDYHRTDRFRGIVKLVDGNRRAMVGFDDFTPNSCQIHVWLADSKGLDRTFIRECFTYAFVTCGLGLLIGVTSCNNTPALELNRRLGFRRVLTIKDGYALGTDMAIQELRREECRWMARDHGRKKQRTSSS